MTSEKYLNWFCLAAETGGLPDSYLADYGSYTTFDGAGYGDGEYGHSLGTASFALGHGTGVLACDE